MANYWLKLYHETLHDPKMGRLSDRLYRRTIEIFLSAGENNNAGSLPPVDDLAWVLRLTEEELEADLVELSKSEIVHKDADRWIVTNFTKRQKADSAKKRKEEQRIRDRQRELEAEEDVTNCDNVVTEDDTIRTTDIDIDIDIDVEKKETKSTIPAPIRVFLDSGGAFKNPTRVLKDGRTVRQKTTERICATVMDLDLWAKIVDGYISCGWSRYSYTVMLDYYERREIPGAAKRSRGSSNKRELEQDTDTILAAMGREGKLWSPEFDDPFLQTMAGKLDWFRLGEVTENAARSMVKNAWFEARQ